MQTAELEEVEKRNSPSTSPLPPSTSSSSSFVQFFVSIWARIKFLFTTAFSEACGCALQSKALNRSRHASITLHPRENAAEDDLAKSVKVETQELVESEAPKKSCNVNNTNNNPVNESGCNESSRDAVLVLPECWTSPEDMSVLIIPLDEELEVVTEYPISSSHYEGNLLTSLVSQQSVLVDGPSEIVTNYEVTTEDNLEKPIKAEMQESIQSEVPKNYTNNNMDSKDDVIYETFCSKTSKDEFIVLPERCSPLEDISVSDFPLDDKQETLVEYSVLSYPHEGDLLTCVTSLQSVLVNDHSKLFTSQAKETHIKHSIVNLVRFENDIEFNRSPEESLCSSTEVIDSNQPFSITVLGRLHTQLAKGDISIQDYNDISKSVTFSTVPRNLSSCPESAPQSDKLYSWECVNSPGLDLDDNEPCQYTTDPESFVDCLIMDAHESFKESSPDPENPDENEAFLGFNTNFTKRIISRKKFSSPPPQISILNVDYPSIPIEAPLSSSAICDSPDFPGPRDLHKVSSSSMDSYMMRPTRSSSLKSDASPCSQSRKIVRFADALGLDLESVHQVLDMDNPPKIPASAILDLKLDAEKSLGSIGAKQFQICFPQPGASGNFIHRVLQSAVCLENARIDSPRGVLTGVIRVKSLGFEKRICVRITYNNWYTFCEIPASYVQDSHDGATDRFSFCAVLPPSMVAGEKAEFSIRYEAKSTGEVFWDNNHGENYVISCHAKATDMAGDGSWIHFI